MTRPFLQVVLDYGYCCELCATGISEAVVRVIYKRRRRDPPNPARRIWYFCLEHTPKYLRAEALAAITMEACCART